MRHAVRALGLATTILWIFLLAFSGTVVYSALQIGMDFEEPEVSVLDGEVTVSVPFSISNGGLYDVSELNITTCIATENGTVVSRSTTPIPLVLRGETVKKTHDIAFSLDDVLSKNLTHLLLNDADLREDLIVGLTYANALPLKISSNLTMPWGAPLSNLTMGEVSVVPQPPPISVNFPLRFENHAFFGLRGTIRLEIFDKNVQVGRGDVDVSVPPGGVYDASIPVTVEGTPRDRVEVRLYLDDKRLQTWTLTILE